MDTSEVSMSYKAIATAVLLLGSCVTLSACNTVAGAGKDVSNAGHTVTDTANDAKKN
jgi:entericidin B